MKLTDLLPEFVAIPTTPFLIGTPEIDLSMLAKHYGGTRESYREESPQHTLTVPSYALARTPVTNALYGAYVSATSAHTPLNWRNGQPPAELVDHPVADISWHEASDFCTWLSTQLSEPLHLSGSAAPEATISNPQFRLPAEAEWEHAARGNDGRLFPWGNEFAPAHANTREAGAYMTTPVGHYPAGASSYGLLDMAGNVWEWTGTLDALYPYDPQDGREQQQAEGRRIARGGCYANPQGFARCACRFRFVTTVRNPFLGFRLAVSL